MSDELNCRRRSSVCGVPGLVGIGVLCCVFEMLSGRRTLRTRPHPPVVSLGPEGPGPKGLARVCVGCDGVIGCEGMHGSQCEEVVGISR
jgi:hypothetical protein